MKDQDDPGDDNHEDEMSDCLGEAQAWHQLNLVEMEQNEVSNEEWNFFRHRISIRTVKTHVQRPKTALKSHDDSMRLSSLISRWSNESLAVQTIKGIDES